MLSTLESDIENQLPFAGESSQLYNNVLDQFVNRRDRFREWLYTFQNHHGQVFRSFSVKNNPIYVPNYEEMELVDRSRHVINVSPSDQENGEVTEEVQAMSAESVVLGGTRSAPMNFMNVPFPQQPAATVVEEIRFLIGEDIDTDFASDRTNFPAVKILIAYSSKEFTTRLMEITLGITGQAAISLLAYATASTSSPFSNSLRGLHFVVAANALGFIGTFIGMWFRRSKKRVATAASIIVGKIGAIAAACAVIVSMGLFLPANAISIWTAGFACLFLAVAVAFS